MRPDWDDQFAEDDDERAERQRAARLANRCPICGRNPNLGYPHKDDCPRRPHTAGQGQNEKR